MRFSSSNGFFQIEPAAQQFYRLLRASHRTGAKAQTDIAALSLSKMLLGPVAGQLGKNRLLIVADGALQYVPFGALPVVRSPLSVVGRKATDHGRLTTDNQQPLIVQHEIVNLPSASVLAVLRRELADRQPASKAVAVIADPVFAATDERVKIGVRGSALGIREKPSTPVAPAQTPDVERSAKESGVMTFDRLRFSRREAEAITSSVGASVPGRPRSVTVDTAGGHREPPLQVKQPFQFDLSDTLLTA